MYQCTLHNHTLATSHSTARLNTWVRSGLLTLLALEQALYPLVRQDWSEIFTQSSDMATKDAPHH